MRNKSAPATSINAQSMGADITGFFIEQRGAKGFFMALDWSAGGTPTGTFFLEAIIEEGDTPHVIASWPISGNSGSETLNHMGYRGGWIRGRYARSGGSGTLTCKFNSKE